MKKRIRKGGVIFAPTNGKPRTRLKGTKADQPKKQKRVYDTVRAARNAALRIASDRIGECERTRIDKYRRGGKCYAQVVRFDGEDGRKQYIPVHKTKGGWAVGDPPTWYPYGIDELPDGGRIFVVEGEKASAALSELGFAATTSAHGSKAASKTKWDALAGRDVLVWPDADEPGHQYAQDVARCLTQLDPPAAVRIIDPPGDDGYDAADFIADQRSPRKAIKALAKNASEYKPPAPADALDWVWMSDVEPEEVRWMWEGKVAHGKLTLLAGDPGVGKSFLSLDLAARITTGNPWPDGDGSDRKPGGVVILSAEDARADTVRPRLDAARGVVSRIAHVKAVTDEDAKMPRPVDLTADMARVENLIERVPDCQLVIVDPISEYMANIDSHVNAEVRRMLARLNDLAERTGVAVVAIHHLNKQAGTGLAAIHRVSGSLGFVAGPRAVWAVTRDDADPERRLMTPVKSNVAPDTSGLAYRLKQHRGQKVPSVVWETEPVRMNAQDAMEPERGTTEEIIDWLRELLADEALPAKQVQAACKEAGFVWRTVQRAARRAGVRVKQKREEGRIVGWVWEVAKS